MKRTLKLAVTSFVVLMFTMSMMTSCSQFDEIWEKLDSIESQLDSIKNDLNAQAEALSALMTNGSTVSSCVENTDGSYTVTLSNGTSFKVLPEGADVSALVSCVDVQGVKCWAIYGPDGELVPLKDANNKVIPVDAQIKVELKDGKYVLVVAGQEFVTGYDDKDVVSVFSSCEVHKDASGQVYAMTFTFGNGEKLTVAVDGYKGVIFKLSNAGSSSPVSEYYINYGSTQTFLLDAEGVVDYVMQIPDGWRVNEYTDELSGDTFVDIIAPKESLVISGAAVASGDLKVVSVVEGGKAAITKLSLSTDPFKVYNVSATKAIIEPYNGIQKYAYGMMTFDLYDKSELIDEINELLTTVKDMPKGYYITEVGIEKTLAEIFGSELAADGEYVFWAVPALYYDGKNSEDAYFYVVEDMLRTRVLAPISASIQVNNVSVMGADIKVDVKGTLSMYAGISVKSDKVFDEIAYNINNGNITPSTNLSYSGPASSFPTEEDSIELEPNTTYVTWVVPVEEEKESYLASDVIYKEFKTLDVQPGGTIELNVGDFTAESSSLSAPISATGAAMIYYAYFNETEGKRFSQTDNATMMSKIQSSATFTSVKADSAVAKIDYIKPETTMWLFAVAVASDGKYGEVVCKSATTSPVKFNALSVALEEISITAKEAIFKVEVTGGTPVDYIYWCGKATDPFWIYEEYSDGTRNGAETYMAANPDSEFIRSSMRANGKVQADGTLVISEFELATTYVLMVLAKDENGLYSKGAYKKFNTPSANLGTVVTSDTDTWKSTKKWIEDNLVWDKDHFSKGRVFATFAADVKIPTDLTAYIYAFGTVSTAMEDIIIKIEEDCSSATTTDPVLTDEEGNILWIYTPDWEDDNGTIHNGRAININNFFSHGCALNGAVTYFSNGVHDETNCPAWENGECSNYAQQCATIAEYCTLDYWIDWVKKEYHSDKYGRPLTNPDKIRAAAEGMLNSYKPYYEDAKPTIYVNDGNALKVINPQAVGPDDQGNIIDILTIVLKDNDGNYYAPMYIDVPNYFK